MKTTAFLAVALTVLPCWASADALRSQLAASDKTVSRFLLAKDVKGFKTYMKGIVTPDFKHVEEGRAIGFDAMCAEMEKGLGQMKKMNQATESAISIQEHGDTAAVTTNHYMQGVMPGPSKKPVFLGFIGTTKDTWVRQHGKWKMSRMEWVHQTMMINGKPVGGAAPATHGKAS